MFTTNGLVRAPEAEGGGGGGTPAPGGNGAAAGDGAGGDGGTPPTGGTGAASGKWFEDARFVEHQDWLTAKGLTTADPLEALEKAVRIGHGAERHLGRPAETLIQKPGKDASLVEWMRGQAEIFGLPEAPDKYDIKRPELPEGVRWDEGFEAKARQVAFENGVPPKALEAFVGAYAEHARGMLEDASSQLQAANAEMMATLERDWGTQTGAKIQAAQAAAAMLGERAGLDAEGIASLAQTLKPKIGDAGTIRLFATIGEMLGEDTLKVASGGTGAALGMTAADARAQLAAMDAPDGEFGRAYHSGNRAEMARLKPKRDALIKVAAANGRA